MYGTTAWATPSGCGENEPQRKESHMPKICPSRFCKDRGLRKVVELRFFFSKSNLS